VRCVTSVSVRSGCESHETVFGVHEGGVVVVDAFSFGGGLWFVFGGCLVVGVGVGVFG